METIAERIKNLEDKVAKLEGANLTKEETKETKEPAGKDNKIFRPLNV